MTFDKALQNLSDTAADPDATHEAVAQAVRAALRAAVDENTERPQVFGSPSHDYSVWYE